MLRPDTKRPSRFRQWRGLACWGCWGGSWRGVGGGRARFCEITAASADLVAIAIGEFNFYFVVTAVGNKVGRAVGDGVLIAKFVADVLKRLIQIVNVIGEKSAAAGFVRESFENLIAFSEMHLAISQAGG